MGWFNAFVGRHLDAFQICRSLAQGDLRLTVIMEQLEAHIEQMKSITPEKLAEFVFNFGEVGPSDWEDREPR
jgi:predicted LPLAT superfamily acyltransferase